MPKPKDFTKRMEKERKELAEKFSRKKSIKSPWGLATIIVRRRHHRKKKRTQKAH
ncbi:MAG: hypothetical protein QXF82_00775 [Nitrososphaeria archaeon]